MLDLLGQGLRASQCPMQSPRQPLTGHRHRPPQTRWYSRRHWSRADPPLGLGGSPGCVNRSPARDRPSPTLSPEPPNGWSHSHLKKKKTIHSLGPPKPPRSTAQCWREIWRLHPNIPLKGYFQKPRRKDLPNRDKRQVLDQSQTLFYTPLQKLWLLGCLSGTVG